MTVSSCKLDSVTVSFGKLNALSQVNLKIDPGERLALVGPSGSGKTTLLRLLNGTLLPSGGKVFIGDKDLAGLNPRELRTLRSQTGFVNQDFSLVPNISVLRNVLLGKIGKLSLLSTFRLLFLTARPALHDAFALLERVGIPEKLYERTDKLSGGQQQRVAIARALIQSPGILLADEPVSSVDPSRARDTISLLSEISEERKLTLCVSMHNIELAKEFFPRLVGLRRGEVAFDLPPEEISSEQLDALYKIKPEEMLVNG